LRDGACLEIIEALAAQSAGQEFLNRGNYCMIFYLRNRGIIKLPDGPESRFPSTAVPACQAFQSLLFILNLRLSKIP
jgi:hypothetical protein